MKRIVLLLLACFPSVFMLAQVPETYWIPDNVGQFNITLFAQLSLAGDIPNSQDSPVANYELGVFDQDGKCCGVAFPPTWKANSQRWVYSLAIQGETGSTYTFKIYDHAMGQEQVLSMACSEDDDHYEFNVVDNPSSPNYGDGCTYGYTYAPDTLHFMPAQTLELSEGWNWVSLYVRADTPVDLLDMLKEALGDKALTIKNRTDYTEYFGEEWGWYGDLDDIGVTNKETIMIEASEADTVTLVGARVNVEQVSITINPGWNWIGFPSAEGMTVAEAFSGFTPEDGDMLKDKVSYATYYDGYGWYEEGGLVTMEPSHGFMYYSNSTAVKTLVLPRR